ncbi:BlaI/MecI/CopY family transcriptional regulator, partial [Parasphingorhabdus sp.]
MTERISDAEHAVMEVLWKRAPMTATEVAEQVVEQKGWSLQTVKTLLSRLAAKAVVA